MEIKNPEKKVNAGKDQLHVDLGTEAAYNLAKQEFEGLENLPPLNLDDLPFEVGLWSMVVEPKRPPSMIRGIAIAVEAQDAEKFKTAVGMVVALGDAAFKSVTEGGIDLSKCKSPKVGQFIMYKHYTGQEAIMQKDGRRLLIMDDSDWLMNIKDPNDWRMYL